MLRKILGLKVVQLAVLSFLLVAAAAAQQNPQGAPGGPGGGGQGGARGPQAPPMTLTSTAFADSTPLPTKYSCAAQPVGVTPPLQWTNAPKTTVSFALILHDLEPRPRMGVDDILHWMMWNIPGTATQLPEGLATDAKLTDGTTQGKNMRGASGYMGPCAPAGIPHHYTFELFALDQKLDLAPDASRADVMKAMDGHIVGHAVLISLFHQ